MQDTLFEISKKEQGTVAQTPNSAQQKYRVLARKYRPQSFSELIGQEVVVKTFKNAIAQKRIHHAFILTGTRGIGKTTTARIIAKSLNCLDLRDGYEPCGSCENCIAITAGRHQDVMEIDAASNTGVDDVREIIEGSMFKPIAGKYKIFIIDEVHMLSKNAFNALLKTLEEPPAHAKFIFATTEAHKIPITIVSRCQKFDLRRVDIIELYKHFKQVCKLENVNADDLSLKMIAASAKGSVRDGLSMLDQAISLSSGSITKEITQEMLGYVDVDLIIDLMHNICAGKLESSIQLAEKLHHLGSDPLMILEDLSKLFYNVTRYKILASENFSLSEKEVEFCKEMAPKLNLIFLTRAWQVLQKGIQDVTQSTFAYETLEIIIIKLHIFNTESSPEELLGATNSKKTPSANDVISDGVKKKF